MAVYAATITSAMKRASHLGNNVYLFAGACALSNYNQTLAEITGISKKFKAGTLISVMADGITSAGYNVKWDVTAKAFKAFKGSAHTHDLLIIGGQAAASTAALAYYATDILGKEAATNKTILGADSATKGGIVSATPTAAAELASDVDAGTFNFIAIGYRG